MDTRLTDILVCPVCRGPLSLDQPSQELRCAKCALGYPIRDDIPRLLRSEARELSPEERERARVRPPVA